jgi:copper chaperone CopZ
MQKIIDTVTDLEGVTKTKIIFDSSKARVYYNEETISEETIIHKIKEIGYDAKSIK